MANRGPIRPGGHNPEMALDSSKGRPFLMVVGASNEVVTVPVKEPSITLGRDRDRDVFVDEPTVSRNHAEILRDSEGCRLRDLNSKNGTFVNRRDIGIVPYQLKDGDEIRLGASFMVLIFRGVADDNVEVSPDQSIQGRLAGAEGPIDGEQEVARTTKSVVWSSCRSREASGDNKIPAGSANVIYAGTVRLKVTVEGDSQDLPHLVEVLKRDPRFVLLQVVSNSPRDADISLTLWEPLPLLNVLAGLDFVAQVNPMEQEGGAGHAGALVEGRERVISVRLSSDSRLSHSS